MGIIDQTQSATKEIIQLKSSQLVEEVKRLIHEGNVHLITFAIRRPIATTKG